MKLKNGAREALLSDILANMDMEQEQEIAPTLLDLLPPVDDLESENSLPNIDVNLFLGEGDNDIPINLGADDAASLSSCDSNDGFEKLFNSENESNSFSSHQIKGKDVQKKLHNTSSLPKSPSESETSEQLKGSNESSNLGDNSCQNYTFYIASKKGKRGRKRKNPEYNKHKHEPNTELKIVIKRMGRENKVCDSNEDSKFSISNKSSTLAEKPSTSSSDTVFPFSNFQDSFTTSIGEQVKTRRRVTNTSSDIEANSIFKSSESVKKSKKLKHAGKSRVQDKKCGGKYKTEFCLNSVFPVNNRNIPTNQNLSCRTEIQTQKNKEQNIELKNTSKTVQPICLIPQTDALNSARNFISETKSIVNNKMNAPKLFFHDYSKLRSPNHPKNPVRKEHNGSCSLKSSDKKSLDLRSGSLLASTKHSAQRFSVEHEPSLLTEESVDVPLSTAEIEISSFEDATVNTKPVYFTELPSEFPPSTLTKSCIHKTFVLKSPLLRNKVLSCENLKSRGCSEGSTSSYGYQSANSHASSPVEATTVLDRFRKSLPKSSSDTSPPPGITCHTKSSSVCDKFDYNMQGAKNENDFPSNNKFGSRLLTSDCSKNENSSFFTLHPNTRSQALSPEKLNHQSNSKFKRETGQRLTNANERDAEFEARRVNFDNRRAIKERRVMYVGNVPKGYTHENLKEQFSCFGEIENVQIKMREFEVHNECGSIFDHEYCDLNTSNWKGTEKGKKIYGFVTFKKHCDVVKAIENGKILWPELNLNYGGRRQFVKEDYSDLDGNFAENTEYNVDMVKKDDFDFARELKEAQKRRGLAGHF